LLTIISVFLSEFFQWELNEYLILSIFKHHNDSKVSIVMIIKSPKIYQALSPLPSESSPRPNAGNIRSNGIVCGADAVRACGSEHGIVGSHLIILADLAKKNDVVFGFRPVNSLATQLLEQGYPTKGLNIKGKSSDWGPMAGFIPVGQEFSKLAGNTKEIQKLDIEIGRCISQGHAVSTPLVINKERLDTLCKMRVITKENTKDAGDLLIRAKNNNKCHIFTAKLSYNNQVAEYSILHEGQPLHVLAKPGKDKEPAQPITADYDLLLFAVPLAKFGAKDNCKPSVVTARAISDKLLQGLKNNDVEAVCDKENMPVSNQRKKISSKSLKNTIVVTEAVQDRGIISPRLNQFIPEINKALGRADDNSIVQHGADTQNPCTVIADNYPGVIFLPERVGHYRGVAMVRNKAEAIQIYKEIKDSGFQFFGNDKWAAEMPVETYRRSSFNEARNALENETSILKGSF
jgi:hypothetical protein